MDFFSQAIQLILSLSLLVALHEAGHYFPAKWFKVRVEKFFLFFDIPFGPKEDRKWDGALVKKKKGNTLFGIGWLPFGGYVKLGGMIDESNDKKWDHIPENEQFRFKPAWQRLIIMIGGVTVNLILGFLIYMMVMGVWGETNIPLSSVEGGYSVDPLMEEYGMKTGDRILYFNDGLVPDNAASLNYGFLNNIYKTIRVEREGKEYTIDLGEDFGQALLNSGVKLPVFPRLPTEVAKLVKDENAAKAGILVNDKIIGVNGIKTPFFDQFSEKLEEMKNDTVQLNIIRNGENLTINCPVTDKGTVGFWPKSAYNVLDTVHVNYRSFSEIVGAGWSYGKRTLGGYVYSLRYMKTKAGLKQVGSVGTIGGLFDASWNWKIFWLNTALLSLILAFMNFLPIPALDGGHIMFLIYEIIRGKPLPQKFLESAQVIGMLLLFALMIFALGMDVIRGFFGPL